METNDETKMTWYNTVFVDTNLNTHLALIVSNSETVFDFKKRLVVEHALCFPEIGKIDVLALKVKRRGCFYRLSESMCVKSAFPGIKKCWFISVDASSVRDDNDGENKNFLVSAPANEVVAQVGYLNDGPKRLLKGCSSSLRDDENDPQLVLGRDGVDGDGKHVSGDIGNMGSRKRKGEENDVEKDELHGINNEGEEGNLESGIADVQDRLFEGKAEETGYDKKRKHRSKKKSRNAMEDLPVENIIQECSERVELCQGEPMYEGNKNIADQHCINAVSVVNKRSDALLESNDGPTGGSNEQKNNSLKSKFGDSDAEDPTHLQAASKEKLKREKKRGDESSVKIGRTSIPDYKEETHVDPDDNDQQSDGIDGGGKHVSGEISTMASQKRKKKDQDIGKDEVRKAENEGQEGNLENDIGYWHDKVLEERAQESGFDKKKKHKSKKKHRVAAEDLPLENTRQECSKSGAELFNDEQVHKVNEGIVDGECINATSDASKRSDTLSQKVDGLAEGSNEDKKTFKDKASDVECEMRDISRLRSGAKKKHKREKKKGDEDSVKEDRILDPDYKKEKLGHPTNTEPLAEEKNENSGHSPGKMENAHVLCALPSIEKRKMKNKLSKTAEEETSSATDVKGNDSRAIKVINSEDFGEETNAASVPGKHVLEPLPSDLYAGKGRLSDAVQESNDKSSLQGINRSDIDLGNAESRHNVPEREISYSADRVKSSKDDGAISAGMHPDVLNQEPNDRDEGTLASGDEIVTHNEEEREKLPSICPSIVHVEKSKLLVAAEECMESEEAKLKLAENSELGDGKKSSKKRKKAKKNNDLANWEQLTSARKHAEVSLNGISLNEAPNYRDNSGGVVAKEESNMHSKKGIQIPEVDAGSTSVLATDREINDVIQNVVESVNKITETFIETENVDGKSRKKSKKRRGSQTNDILELQTENGNVFHKDHSKEVDSTSNMLKDGNDSTVQNGTLASVLATDREINDVIPNVVESVNKITETFIETENVDGKSRKKSKKRRGSQTNNVSELQTENGDVFHKDHTKEADSTSKMLKGGNDSTVENGTLAPQLNSVSFETSELPPPKLKVDNEAKTGDVGDNGSHIQASSENNRISFHDYFVPGQINHETVAPRKVLIDKTTELEGVNGEQKKAKKKKKNVNVHPSAEVKTMDPSLNENQKENPEPGVISSKGLAPSSNENRKEKPKPGRNSSNIEPASSFSKSMDKPIKPSEVSGGVRVVPSSKSGEPKSDPNEARKYDAAKLSMGGRTKIGKEAGTASISSLESSKNLKSPNKSAHRHQSDKKHNNAFNKKATISNAEEVVSSSQHGNRLAGRLGAIFKGDISRPPATEDSSDSSDATTRTPSDNTSSSGQSDEESSADSSSQSGSYGPKRKGGGRKNSAKLRQSGMSLDAILRSSSRYKKAKITASQSQLEDTESQPVEFVPESEPID